MSSLMKWILPSKPKTRILKESVDVEPQLTMPEAALNEKEDQTKGGILLTLIAEL